MLIDNDLRQPPRSKQEILESKLLHKAPKHKPPRYDRRTDLKRKVEDHDMKSMQDEIHHENPKKIAIRIQKHKRRLGTLGMSKSASEDVADRYMAEKRFRFSGSANVVVEDRVSLHGDDVEARAGTQNMFTHRNITSEDLNYLVRVAHSKIDPDLASFNSVIAARTALDYAIWESKMQGLVDGNLYKDVLTRLASFGKDINV